MAGQINSNKFCWIYNVRELIVKVAESVIVFAVARLLVIFDTEDSWWQVPTQRFLNHHKLVWIVNNDVNICKVSIVSWCSGLVKVPIYQPTGNCLQSWLQSDVQPSTICFVLGNNWHSVLRRERCYNVELKDIHFYPSHSWLCSCAILTADDSLFKPCQARELRKKNFSFFFTYFNIPSLSLTSGELMFFGIMKI